MSGVHFLGPYPKECSDTPATGSSTVKFGPIIRGPLVKKISGFSSLEKLVFLHEVDFGEKGEKDKKDKIQGGKSA